ncbi:MAG: PA14 domain-containing protein [Planctomycetota bacterium]
MRRVHVAASGFAALFVCGSLLTVLSQPPGGGSLTDSFDSVYSQQASPTEKARQLEQWMSNNDWDELPFDRRTKLMSGLGHRSDVGEIISARWTGSLTAPATGEYTMQVHQNECFRGTCRLWVGDSLVVDASDIKAVCEGEARFASDPIVLTAGQPVALKMEYAGEPLVWRNGPGGKAMAEMITTLMWKQGNGLVTLIPASALSPPSGSGDSATGVKAEFFSDQSLEELAFTRISSSVELPSRIVDTNEQWESHLTVCKNCYGTLTAPEFEAAVAQDPVGNYWENSDVGFALEFTGSSAREQYTSWLLSHPSVLAADPGLFASVFSRLAAAPDGKRIDLLRAWASERPLKPVKIGFYPDEYSEENASYEWLGRWLTGQNAEELKMLVENDLEMPNGHCRMELSRVLAYSAVECGQAGWFRQELLDQMEGLRGDAQVSWLLALAAYEEVGSGFPVRPNLAIPYLEQAMLLAETDGMRFQVLGQYVPRLASIGEFSEATSVLDRYADRFEAAEQVSLIAQWRSEIQALETSWADKITARKASQEEANRDERVAMLQERLDRAQQNGRTTLAAKYRDMIASESE